MAAKGRAGEEEEDRTGQAVVLVSSLTDSTGNRTTALRLGRHVGAVALYDCSEQPP